MSSARERALQQHRNDGGLSDESFEAGWDAAVTACAEIAHQGALDPEEHGTADWIWIKIRALKSRAPDDAS